MLTRREAIKAAGAASIAVAIGPEAVGSECGYAPPAKWRFEPTGPTVVMMPRLFVGLVTVAATCVVNGVDVNPGEVLEFGGGDVPRLYKKKANATTEH